MMNLPVRYMMKCNGKRAEMHKKILMALENISSSSLQNIYRHYKMWRLKDFLYKNF